MFTKEWLEEYKKLAIDMQGQNLVGSGNFRLAENSRLLASEVERLWADMEQTEPAESTVTDTQLYAEVKLLRIAILDTLKWLGPKTGAIYSKRLLIDMLSLALTREYPLEYERGLLYEKRSTCSIHPFETAVYWLSETCDCGENVFTAAFCQWCRENLDPKAQKKFSKRNMRASHPSHADSFHHKLWLAGLIPGITENNGGPT